MKESFLFFIVKPIFIHIGTRSLFSCNHHLFGARGVIEASNVSNI